MVGNIRDYIHVSIHLASACPLNFVTEANNCGVELHQGVLRAKECIVNLDACSIGILSERSEHVIGGA